jgi:hypothetical protein
MDDLADKERNDNEGYDPDDYCARQLYCLLVVRRSSNATVILFFSLRIHNLKLMTYNL